MSAMSFQETLTHYNGRRERTAVVAVGGKVTQLGLAGTAQCAVRDDLADLTAKNLYAAAQVPLEANAGVLLRDYCRSLTGWKPRLPRY